MRLKSARLIAWLAAAALVAAGCDNNPLPAEPPGKAYLHLSLGDDPTSLDPSGSLLPTIVDNLYPAYFSYDYLKRNPLRLNLELGAAWPKREPYRLPNGRMGERWSFRLRKGLRFQDDACFPGGKGREIVAADVVFGIKRLADPSISAPYFSYIENRVWGLAAFAEHNSERLKHGLGADFDKDVPGLRLDPKDRYAFQIILTEPFPELKYVMALRCCAPQAREAWNAYGPEIRRHPVGCGPYVLSEYRPKQRLLLTPNPNWTGPSYPSEGAPGDAEAGLLDDAGKPLPRNDGILYSILKENVSSWNQFLQGYQDAWSLNQANYQSVMTRPGQLSPDMKRRGIKLITAMIPNIVGFIFNMDDPTFGGLSPAKRKLRQAISLSIDRQEIIDLFVQGNALPAEFLVPPGIGGYDPSYRNPFSGPNLTKAQALLSEAGFPNGINSKTGERLVLHYDSGAQDSLGRQFVSLVSRQIGRLGIEVVQRSWRPVVMSDRQVRGQFQFIGFDWYADYPDPEMFLLMLYSPNKRPGMNRSNYRNPVVDRLFEKIRIMEDGPARAALIHRVRDIVVEDCPWVYLGHYRSVLISQPWLRDRKQPEVDADMTRYWAIDQPMRQRLVAEWNRPKLWPIGVVALFAGVGLAPVVVAARSRGRRSIRERGGR